MRKVYVGLDVNFEIDRMAEILSYALEYQYMPLQKQYGIMLKMYMFGALLYSPKIKAQMENMMNEGMLAPYKKVLKTDKK